MSKQWIRKYTLALCKELLGIIRSKYGSIPIPGGNFIRWGDFTFDYRRKKWTRRTIREMLDVSTGDELMTRRSGRRAQEILKKVPLSIYIG